MARYGSAHESKIGALKLSLGGTIFPIGFRTVLLAHLLQSAAAPAESKDKYLHYPLQFILGCPVKTSFRQFFDSPWQIAIFNL